MSLNLSLITYLLGTFYVLDNACIRNWKNKTKIWTLPSSNSAYERQTKEKWWGLQWESWQRQALWVMRHRENHVKERTPGPNLVEWISVICTPPPPLKKEQNICPKLWKQHRQSHESEKLWCWIKWMWDAAGGEWDRESRAFVDHERELVFFLSHVESEVFT